MKLKERFIVGKRFCISIKGIVEEDSIGISLSVFHYSVFKLTSSYRKSGWLWHGGDFDTVWELQISHKVISCRNCINRYLSGYQMRPMPFLHEMYFLRYLGLLILCQSRPPCQSHPHLRYHLPNAFNLSSHFEVFLSFWKNFILHLWIIASLQIEC